MKIFPAGATGAVGQRLVPLLISRGHSVTGTTRTPNKAADLRAAGAEPVILDALDRDAVLRAVALAKPEVVVHQLTALSNFFDLRRLDEGLAVTNRLRTDGTDYLLAGAREAGARIFIAQSYTGWPNAREGGRIKTENDELDANPPKAMRQTLEAIRRLEATVVGVSNLTGIVLRYGAFYGPGTSIGPGGPIVEMVRKRRFPIVGGGTGVWSFIHIDDVATATMLAIEGGTPGIYNIVDDEPAEVSVWLPELARAIGAPPPYRLPAWIGRFLIGEAGLSMMTTSRGSSNGKAKRLLHWQPKYASWREGLRTGLVRGAAESSLAAARG
jgi:nucleoside-diphosphate-sugar epimerase